MMHIKKEAFYIQIWSIADRELFSRAKTDGFYVRWDKKLEISIDEIFQLAQK